MIKLILLVFLCSLTTGYLQEITSSLFPSNVGNDNTVPQIWSLQNIQGQRKRVKPCPRRSNNKNAEEQWIPSYSSRITKPLYENTVLQPQALKNEEFKESKPDVKSENDIPSPPSRRNLGFANNHPIDNNPVDDNKDDCFEHLETDKGTPSSTADATQAALKLLEDCLLKKQNSLDQNTLTWPSRRSMSDPDDSNLLDNDNNNLPQSNPIDLLDSDHNNNYPLDSSADISHYVEDGNVDKLATKLMDAEKVTGIAERRSYDTLSKSARVCYACSSATNPTCWEPDKRTTVKYCTKEQSCVTKTFGIKNSLTMIRDCANSCDDSAVPGLEPKYKSCKLCHSDYCNGAISINGYNLVIILIISIIKCTF